MRKSSIRGVAFDKDGTLLRYDSFWLPVARPAITALLASRGLDDSLCEEMLLAVGADRGIDGILCHGTYAQIGEGFNTVLRPAHPHVRPFDGAETAEAFGTAAKCGQVEAACADIRGLFLSLRSRGVKTAVITTDTTEMTRWCLTELGIADLVDYIYGDDGDVPTKPDPHFMQCFCRELGCTPEEVLMVGDSITDVRFAQNSGAHSMAVGEGSASLGGEFSGRDISAVPEVLDALTGEGA